MEIRVNSLDEMCGLMCENRVPTEGKLTTYMVVYDDTHSNYWDLLEVEANTAQEAVNQFRRFMPFSGVVVNAVYKKVKNWR